MTIEKAITIMHDLTLSQNEHFNNAKEAYNTIVKYITDKDNKDNNVYKELAFKLYVMCYNLYLNLNNSSVYDQIAVKEFHKKIDKSINFHVYGFLNDLITYDQSLLLKRSNISLVHPNQKSEIINDKENEVFLNAMENPNNIKIAFGESWSYDEVNEKLHNQFLNLKH